MPWDCEVILSPPAGDSEAPDHVDEGDFRFYADGTFRFSNRTYPDKQALDVYHGGFHVFRDAGSRRITIWASGGERIVFECQRTLSGARWLRYIPRAIDEAGTPDEDPRPTRTVSFVLYMTRLWHNLVGAVTLLGGGLYFLVLVMGVLAILVSFVMGLFW